MTPSIRKTAAATLACVVISQALGDAIVVTRAGAASTIAELFVESDGMRVEIEVGARGLKAFSKLLPDDVYEAIGLEPGDASGRIRKFFAQDWVMRFDGSPPVAGRVIGVRAGKRLARDEITGEPLVVQQDDADDVLSVELAYAWDKRPATISIRPPMSEDGRTPLVDIGFVLYHDGEDWQAWSEQPLRKGQSAVVTAIEGLVLRVRAKRDQESGDQESGDQESGKQKSEDQENSNGIDHQ